MEIDVKSFVTALGLAVVMTGPALAQFSAGNAPAPMQQTGNSIVQAPARPATAGGFSKAATNPNEEGYPSTAEPSSPRTSWQFGPWLGRYPTGQ